MNDKMTIYGYAEGCPACDDLKTLLDLLSIPYDFIPVERGGDVREAMRDLGYTTLPQAFDRSERSLGGLSEFRKVARLGLCAAGMLT